MDKVIGIISDLGFDAYFMTNRIEPSSKRGAIVPSTPSAGSGPSEIRRQSFKFLSSDAESISQYLCAFSGIVYFTLFEEESRIDLWVSSNSLSDQGRQAYFAPF